MPTLTSAPPPGSRRRRGAARLEHYGSGWRLDALLALASAMSGARSALKATQPALACLMLAATLAGCAMPAVPSFGTAEPNAPSPALAPAPMAAAMTARPADPLAAFIATAAPGATADVAGYGVVRLARAYTAASGRDCREAMVGRGVEERASIYCRGPQGWVAARPLLRSGTMAGPMGGVARP